jgi:apolipoprotein N-acyltransferase
MTLRALAEQPRVDVVVWPETAVPSVPRPRVTARVQALAVALQVPIVYGSYDVERINDKRFKLFNAAFHMEPSGRVAGRYAKHKLLVFGEYVPLSERFPVLLDLLPTPGEFTPGPGPAVFDVGTARLAPVICYELLFPRVVRAGLRAGGEALVNLTNDYWFGRHLEPEQHLALTRMCAIEIGRPILRATNTGITALVDGTGTVVQRAGLWTQEVLIGSVPLAPMRWTPYARWGERVLLVVAAAAWNAAAGVHRWLGPRGT